MRFSLLYFLELRTVHNANFVDILYKHRTFSISILLRTIEIWERSRERRLARGKPLTPLPAWRDCGHAISEPGGGALADSSGETALAIVVGRGEIENGVTWMDNVTVVD